MVLGTKTITIVANYINYSLNWDDLPSREPKVLCSFFGWVGKYAFVAAKLPKKCHISN